MGGRQAEASTFGRWRRRLQEDQAFAQENCHSSREKKKKGGGAGDSSLMEFEAESPAPNLMKKIAIAAFLALLSCVSAHAEEADALIKVDGVYYRASVEYYDDWSYVSLMDFQTFLSGTEKEFTFTETASGYNVRTAFDVGIINAALKDNETAAGVKPLIINGSMHFASSAGQNGEFLKLRDLAEAFDSNVSYNQSTKAIILNTDKRFEYTADLDEAYQASLNELEKYKATFAVVYKNMLTGRTLEYNSEKLYYTASIIKAPYALMVYDKSDAAGVDLKAVFHELTSELRRGGDGSIKNMKLGTLLTEQEVLTHAIVESDNTALRMLIEKYGVNAFKDYFSSKGVDVSSIWTINEDQMTARSASDCLELIYDFFETGKPYALQLKLDMMTASNPMLVSSWPMAHKYGSGDGSFNDTAIVFSEMPYTLAVLSNRTDESEEDYEAFRNVSRIIEALNSKESEHFMHGG
ncbi:MAG: class A beta-lactamase-related serine hydrolase [Clostridiales bacterium]|nr:class A beta-lactamase-related serine hydrolase [Clostridiales bacterium]